MIACVEGVKAKGTSSQIKKQIRSTSTLSLSSIHVLDGIIYKYIQHLVLSEYRANSKMKSIPIEVLQPSTCICILRVHSLCVFGIFCVLSQPGHSQIQYSQTCLQGSVTRNDKSGLCRQVAFDQSICPIFTRRIKTGFCGQETTTRRCPYAQV